jgi:hypothetical protein
MNSKKGFVEIRWNHARRRDGGLDLVDGHAVVLSIWIRLYNFRINRWDLRKEHYLALDEVTIPFLKEDFVHTVQLVGLTSRSGPEAYNQPLSERRAQTVFEYLKKRGISSSQLDKRYDNGGVVGIGEKAARGAGEIDGSENSYFRAVELWLWTNPVEKTIEHNGIFPRQLPPDHGFV